jgi:hypothetical protein
MTEIELQLRHNIGPAIGWGYYAKDEEFDYAELIIYLTFISLHIRWE